MEKPAGALVARGMYRYLRLMMITLPTLLLVGTVIAFFKFGTVEMSISAYYLGPIRDLFVGVMVAIAACLVVYRGWSALEDLSLDVAGFLAVFVALVPTDLDLTLAALDAAERAELIFSLRASSVAVLAVSALFILVEIRTAPWRPVRSAVRGPARMVAAVIGAVLIAFVVLVVWRVVEGEEFAWVHTWAAVLLIASLAVAVASHAWPDSTGADGAFRDPARRDHRGKYRVIFFLMVAGLPLYGLLYLLGWEYALLAVEWYEIALFVLFWVLETRRTWSAWSPGSWPEAARPARPASS